MLRNVAGQKWRVYAWDVTSGLPKTGDAANIAAKIQIDDGAAASTNDAAPTEVDATNQKGFYEFDTTQAETNGAKLSLAPQSSTSNIAVIACPPVIYTRPQYFSLLGIASDGDLAKVNLLDGHTPQTGDVYTLANGASGFVAIKTETAANATDLATLLGRLTAARAGYMDNLNAGGVLASQADINALNQSASRRMIVTTLGHYERPESGSVDYTIEVRTYDGDGAAVDADSTPSLAMTGNVNGDLSGNLSAASNPSTGLYRWEYTVANDDDEEQIRVDASATISSSVFTLSAYTQVLDQASVPFNATHASQLAAIYNKLPSKTYLTGTANSDGDVQADEATGNFPGTVGGNAGDVAGKVLGGGGSTITGTGARAVDASGNAIATASALATTDGKVDTISTNVTTLLARITSTLFSGITSIAQWLGLIAGKQTGDSTARTELRATGAGSGTFDETTDSLEAIVDAGAAGLTQQQVRDAMKLAPTAGSPTAGSVDAHLDAIESKTGLITSGGIQVSNGSHVIAAGDTLQLVQGQKYSSALNNAISLSFTDARLPATIESDGTLVYLRVAPAKGTQGETLALAGSIASFDSGTGAVTVEFEATSEQTASLRAGELTCIYEVDWHIAGNSADVLTSQAEGPCTVLKHIA